MSKLHCALGALLVGLAGPASGTTMLAQDIVSLSRGADAVVQGKVTRVESRWNGDRTRIITEVDIEISEALKGAPGKKITVVQPGGVVGEIGQQVGGVASFREGEEVVVFLEARPGSTFLVSGMAQGKFRVERSSDGKAAFAIPEVEVDALLLDPATRAPVPPRVRPVKLEELKAQVRAALGTPPAGKR
ncbi:MAG: hypothetical protein HYZ28_07940 [Myxococcales bacterium]|nr:hypothetical protein [Myxococcales bacterium]